MGEDNNYTLNRAVDFEYDGTPIFRQYEGTLLREDKRITLALDDADFSFNFTKPLNDEISQTSIDNFTVAEINNEAPDAKIDDESQRSAQLSTFIVKTTPNTFNDVNIVGWHEAKARAWGGF